MKEIELKFKINNEKNIVDNLKEIGCNESGTVVQTDVVFAYDENIDFNNMKPGTIIIRIRKIENGKTYLTLKKSSIKSYECEEIEFCVENIKKVSEFILTLGFTKVIEFTKIRKKFMYGKFNICIDIVDNIGTYIEIENLTDMDNSEEIKNEILEIAKQLRINIDEIESRYYPQIILENEIRSDSNDKENRSSYNI